MDRRGEWHLNPTTYKSKNINWKVNLSEEKALVIIVKKGMGNVSFSPLQSGFTQSMLQHLVELKNVVFANGLEWLRYPMQVKG